MTRQKRLPNAATTTRLRIDEIQLLRRLSSFV
jgi:hypothetical protein